MLQNYDMIKNKNSIIIRLCQFIYHRWYLGDVFKFVKENINQF